MTDIAWRPSGIRNALTTKRSHTSRPHPTGATSLPTEQIAVDALRSGSLLFCRRRGPFQLLTDIAGDVFHHVAVVEGDGTEALVHEVSRSGYRTRPIAEVVDCYEHIAVARLQPCHQECRTDIGIEASAQVATQKCTYLPDSYMWIVGLLSLTRAYAPFWIIGLVLPRVASGIDRALRKTPGANPYRICSSFIVDLTLRACASHNLMPQLYAPKTQAQTDHGRTLPTALVLPDDLWRSPALTAKAWLTS